LRGEYENGILAIPRFGLQGADEPAPVLGKDRHGRWEKTDK
jgi:hypothetical protein